MNNSKVRMEASLLWFPEVQYYFQLEQVFIYCFLLISCKSHWLVPQNT